MRKRNHRIRFRLNEKEVNQLNRDVKKSGLSHEGYLRQLMITLAPGNAPPPDYSGMAKKLYEVGTNLNQVAHKAHILNAIDAQHYADTVASMKRVIAEITIAVMQARRLNYDEKQGEELCKTETGGNTAKAISPWSIRVGKRSN
ncbi:MAG: plasmid mobilization relaxosome protein MobC [Bacillota bacterium]